MNAVSQSLRQTSIQFVIDRDDYKRAVVALNSALCLNPPVIPACWRCGVRARGAPWRSHLVPPSSRRRSAGSFHSEGGSVSLSQTAPESTGPTTEVFEMRETIAALAVLALLASGCSKEDITPEEARNAIPEASAIRIDTPKDAADVAPRRPASASATASRPRRRASRTELRSWSVHHGSDYARWSYVTAWTVNGGVVDARDHPLHHAVPPTACAEDTCTWGPWDEASRTTPR